MSIATIRTMAFVAVSAFACLTAATSPPAQAQTTGSRLDAIVKAKKIRVGMAPFAPFVYKDPKTNKLEGFEVEAAQLLAKDLGVELEIIEASWATIFAGLHTDKFDIVMSGSKRTLQRALAVSFSDAYVSLIQVAMVRKKDNIKSWADIDKKGANIASQLGGAGYLMLSKDYPQFVKNATLTPYRDAALCGDAVISGQAIAWFDDVVNLGTYMKNHPDAGLEFIEAPFPAHGEGNGYAIRRGDPDFLNWINIFVAKNINNGTYARLAEKYGLPPNILVKGWANR